MTARAKAAPLCNDRNARLSGPPPCFFFRACRNRAELEKAGRSLCRQCARRFTGPEFPLRDPAWKPEHPDQVAFALDMKEGR